MKISNPPKCKCGCNLPTGKYFDKSGKFNSYLRYIPEHKPGVVIDGMKICKICNKKKFVKEFGTTLIRGYSRISSYCKPCHTQRGINNRLKHYGTMRNYWLQTRYGITEQEFNEMNAKQNGICPLCNKRPSTVVDHCHQSNKVRGILCMQCNNSLGIFGDTEQDIQRVIEYFQKA